MKRTLLGTSAAALLALAAVGCDVDVKDKGALPDVDVDVKEGRMPDVDVRGPDVDVKTKDATVKVPDVDVKSKEVTVKVPDVDVKSKDVTVKVPDVNVRIPKENENEDAPKDAEER